MLPPHPWPAEQLFGFQHSSALLLLSCCLLSTGYSSVMNNLTFCALKRLPSMEREIWKLKTLVLFYSSVIKVWDLRRNYATFRQDPLPIRSFCYPGTSTRKLGKALDRDLLQGRVNLRSTVSDISYLYSQVLIRPARSAGYFDCQYQIFKLKTEPA